MHQSGAVRDAIVATLATDPEKPRAVSEIYESCRGILGDDIPLSSIRSYLSGNTPSKFTRVSRGHYVLSEAPLAFENVRIDKAILYRGDSISWLRIAARNSIQAVVTDPPYGLLEYTDKEKRKLRAGKGGVWRLPPSFDGCTRSPLPRFTVLTDSQREGLYRFFLEFARALYPVLVPGAHLAMASNPLLSHIASRALDEGGFERRGEIIRLVQTLRGGDRPKNHEKEFANVTVMPRSQWEPWLLYRKPCEGTVADNLRKWGAGALMRDSDERPFGDVIKSAPTNGREKKIAPHPSLKPQAFMRTLVKAMLPLGMGTVLDPFAGSGSTLAAANHVGYRSIGIELDDHYFAMAAKSIEALSNLEA